MSSGITLTSLPKLPLCDRKQLPEYPAIYFVLDANQRVLYIGQANNLRTRWQGQTHHRLNQLQDYHRKSPVFLTWIDYTNRPEQLDEDEALFIEQFHPLLNQTRVPAKKLMPAEVMLQRNLQRIADRVVVFGIEPPQKGSLLTIQIKYRFMFQSRPVNFLRNTFKANTKTPNNLRWVEFRRSKFGACWRTKCNGVSLMLMPWSSTHGFEIDERRLQICQIAGVSMPGLTQPALSELLQIEPLLPTIHPNLEPAEKDPIPLFWSR
ncbi:GIY-YIG nuclease family protein [Nodosilinea sp. FACHB-131]|uniref:GIY-YIG nuclease family protein n=1 Tax=Cyanophyceae TaxID=3028117 RepID=UPI00168A3C3C|nr:GIY-YIG nuclease family protein [Nodosilinea sp. FACHB-131]MBD1876986.1 GIY-YIG nuclease family protein [Nodosilinea sp. FACHB-131]